MIGVVMLGSGESCVGTWGCVWGDLEGEHVWKTWCLLRLGVRVDDGFFCA